MSEAHALPSSARVRALLRLELADALRSRWLAFATVSYVAVFGLFGWLGMRESAVLGFTGISRVVLNAGNAIAVVLPLVALVATSQTVTRARASGYFELLLTHPCRRSEWFLAAWLARTIVLIGPLIGLLSALVALGAALGEPPFAVLAGRALLVSISLVIAFVGIGALIATVARSPERAVVTALLVWLAAAALHDFALIGLMLEYRLEPRLVFLLSGANPVEAARLALLSGIDPELSVLGPVGFWTANVLGPAWTLVAGVAWPITVGVGASALALHRLNRSDLIG